MLVGREDEQRQLLTLVERARDGSAGAILILGEPGMGKTALLEWLTESVGRTRTLQTRGFESEAPLAFSALHRLLLPLKDVRADLPGPQARALRVALGEEDGAAVEPFLVSVATLTTLTAAAEEGLVLCVVDDVHWLDPASRDVLFFCARRIDADQILMVFAAREEAEPALRPTGIPHIELQGLDADAAHALLRAGQPDASRDVAARLVAETRGNPLALVELPVGLTAAQRAGTAPLPARLALTDRVQQVFLDRTRRLETSAQQMLLLVAADDVGELAMIRVAADRIGVATDALEAALAAGLLSADGERVRVRHPLVRSAIYSSASHADRRQAHLALAAALAGSGDRDRETWHRAAAADTPDPAVTEALTGVGARAERSGAYASAVAAYRRAAELTHEVELRAALSFAAARNAWACGQLDSCRQLLAAASTSRNALLRSDIARLRGRIEVNVGSAVDAHRIFVEAARAIREVDPQRALELAAIAAIMAAHGGDSGSRLDPAQLLSMEELQDSTRDACLVHLLSSMSRLADGDWSGALTAFEGSTALGDQVDDLDVLGNLGNAALLLGDVAAQQHFYSRSLSLAREAGAAMAAIYALHRLCFGHFVTGEWSALRSASEEALSLGAAVGVKTLAAPSLAWLALLAALQGRDDFQVLRDELAAATTAQPLGILTDPVHDLTRWAAATHDAATGDYVGALHQLSRMRLPVLRRLAAVDRIEAAVRAGETGLAATWVDELGEFASATARPWALGAVAYGRAMTAEGSAASDALFTESLIHYADAGQIVDQARVQLAYGEWLRRAQRRVDARKQLRLALATFEDVHADLLAHRAAEELRASGETARKRDPSTLLELTPMERKVAQLVSAGLSNKEAAAQIWVSPRTVAFHLRNVFAKAGITSRGELARFTL